MEIRLSSLGKEFILRSWGVCFCFKMIVYLVIVGLGVVGCRGLVGMGEVEVEKGKEGYLLVLGEEILGV